METKNQIGKKVMIRTYSAGVHFGTLVHKEYTPAGTVVILEDARRIYSWEGANTLSDLSTIGSTKISECKISMPVKDIELISIEIITMTDVAIDNLFGGEYWKCTTKLDTEIDQILAA